jgi:LmbE family N-acetylglucosaminyl deacetylase
MRRRTTIKAVAVLGLAWGTAGLACTGGPPVSAQDSPRTLLAVFAHADDEEVIMPLLARYAREGVDVHLAIATDGQKGAHGPTSIPAGEALAEARADEARCSCEALGIHPPILIGLVDGELHERENQATLLKEITRLFAELKPDVVITWGPDGVTGHTDHRLVNSLVTQVFQAAEGDAPGQLYCAGLPTERLAALAQGGGLGRRGERGPREAGGPRGESGPGQARGPRDPRGGPGGPGGFATVRSRYLPVRIAYQEEDGKKAAEALACHKSQYPPEVAAQRSGMARALENGTVYLRPWYVETEPITDLFE